LPFFAPDLHIVVADPHRPGHELRYHPGEANLRRADVVVINKVDTASPEGTEQVRANVRAINPEAAVIEAACPIFVEDGPELLGRRVLVVEDGPTLTHGEMAYGAGLVLARKLGAVPVDPRRFAVGSIAEVFRRYPHMGPLLPAMGYGDRQVKELEETINRTQCDLVLIATPIDLRRVARLDKPSLRVRYQLQEIGQPTLLDVVKARMGW
ncbi:MAG: GTPase, partial [Acetobacteraceae bacterium]|nr:GTPase [Acetobacteraceae bacterium]